MERRKNTMVSNEVRKNLIDMIQNEGISIKEASRLLKIKYPAAKKIYKIYETENRVKAKKRIGKPKTKNIEAVKEIVDDFISLEPQTTLKKIQYHVQEKIGLDFTISMSTINRCLLDLKITLKKAHRELDRVNNPEKILLRKDYSLWYGEISASSNTNIVFIDESSFNLHLKGSRARSVVGTRANILVPTMRGGSTTLIGAISKFGFVYHEIISNRTVNAQIFKTFFDNLCKHLKDNLRLENVWLVLDNAKVHKKEDLIDVCRIYGYSFKYLSPYSYMLNPMENAFSKIKEHVKSCFSFDINTSLKNAIESGVESITSNDCEGFYRYIQRNITNCAAQLPYIHQ